MADEPKVITTIGAETFLDVGNPPINLLRVHPDVPIEDAYEQVSILLGYIKQLVREGDMEDDHKLPRRGLPDCLGQGTDERNRADKNRLR